VIEPRSVRATSRAHPARRAPALVVASAGATQASNEGDGRADSSTAPASSERAGRDADAVVHGARRGARDVEQGAEMAARDVEQGAEMAARDVEQGAEMAARDVRNAACGCAVGRQRLRARRP
jgi:hypothetical protein